MLNFFYRKSIGIDISDHYIELVELKKIAGKISVRKIGRSSLPEGVVKNGRLIDGEKLIGLLRKAMAEAQPKPISSKKIVFGFPESQTFFHTFSYGLSPDKKLSEEEKDQIIFKEAWSNIPIVKKEMLLFYQVLNEGKSKIDFLIVAAMKSIVAEWHEFFRKNNFEVILFDVETLANYRSIYTNSRKPVCIIDIGADTTNLSIFFRGKMIFEREINIAGEDLTLEIVKTLNITEEEAERKKIEIGLSKPEEPFFTPIIKILENLLEEVKICLSSFEKKNQLKIESLFFVGGTSKLRGLPDYFGINLGLTANLGEAKYLNGEKLEFIGAIGMALRGINLNKYKDEPVIPCENLENNEELTGDIGLKDEGIRQKIKSSKFFLIFILIIGLVLLFLTVYFKNFYAYKTADSLVNIKETVDNPSISNANLSTSTEASQINSESAINATSTQSKTSSTEEDSQETKFAVIKNTETGYLNVREGPGTIFKIIIKVYPDSRYELIESKGEWAKIKIEESVFGWVATKYIK